MAEFSKAYARVREAEGDYAKHSADRGGETWKGIARVHHPSWPGWGIIDVARGDPRFPKQLAEIPELQVLVEELYEELYWKRLEGDSLPQPLADRLFDVAVNMGTSRAMIFLQIGLNVLNRAESLWPEVKVDGVLGPATRHARTAALLADEALRLTDVVRHLAAARHIELALQSPSQRVFIRGWLTRDAE